MRVLVCGGRDYADRRRVCRELDELFAQGLPARFVLIQGGARGADSLARDWAFSKPSILLINEPANWAKHGRAAGPIRNQRMIDLHRPDRAIAFPGGRGTADMVRRLREASIPVSCLSE